VSSLVSFVEALEMGYSKHRNPYHNLIHAADVTQTAHYLMLHTGIMVRALTQWVLCACLALTKQIGHLFVVNTS